MSIREKPEIVLDGSGRQLAIYYVTVGSAFGTAAQLRFGSRVVAETDVVPYGFTGAAREQALDLARTLRA